MKTNRLIILLLLSLTAILTQAQNWPQWRGFMNTGTVEKGSPPVKFGENENLKWKIAIPGKGHSTPVIWGDKIVVQTTVATQEKGKREPKELSEGERRMSGEATEFIHDFKVLLIDLNTGKTIWEKTVIRELPEENTHNLGSWASNSPCTDGEYIFAYFGSRGIFCLDFNGNIIWQKDFGQMMKSMSFGEGESPYLYKDKLFIQWDHEGESFVVALNKNTGEEIWKASRDEKTSWATPLVVEVNGKPQLITVATNQVRSYDANTGDIIWTSTGMTRNCIPNPLYADGILYVMSGFRGSALQAIDLTKAKGDITGTPAVLWTYNQDTPYTPSPLLMNGKLYFLRANNGFLTCLDAKTGSVIYSKIKLEGISDLYSSISGAGDKIYIASENICLVIKAGDQFEILSSNKIDDNFHASPVISGNKLILRGFNSLYCFSE